jgi:cysteine desulfurase / selenocysteine lyase
MNEGALFDPRDFVIADGIAHLCAGGESACPHRHASAFSRYLRDKSNGMAGRVAQEAEIARAREGIARAWHVDIASIGFVGNVAEGVSMVAESLDWRDGDNLVVDANEYPSVVGPFQARRSSRVTLRQARGTGPGRYAACVDARTRAIGVSYVSYLTGERQDLAALRALADSRSGERAEVGAKLPHVTGIRPTMDRLKQVEKVMLDAAKNLEFEKAAKLRDELRVLRERLFIQAA